MTFPRDAFSCLTGFVLLVAPFLCQQNDPRGEQDRQPGKTADAPTAPLSRNDQILAAWLISDNENEVAISRIAQERSSNEEVKQFARRMVEDHQQALNKLQRLAGAPTGVAGVAGKPGDPQPPAGAGTGHPADASGQRGGMARDGGTLDVVQLKRDLAQRCLMSARRELEQKQGAEFDQCFMFMQVGAHVHAVDTLEVFKSHASGQLRQCITEALPAVQQHLEHARRLAKSLEGSTTADPKRGGNGR